MLVTCVFGILAKVLEQSGSTDLLLSTVLKSLQFGICGVFCNGGKHRRLQINMLFYLICFVVLLSKHKVEVSVHVFLKACLYQWFGCVRHRSCKFLLRQASACYVQIGDVNHVGSRDFGQVGLPNESLSCQDRVESLNKVYGAVWQLMVELAYIGRRA